MGIFQAKWLSLPEKELFAGAYGRNLTDLFRDIANSRTLNPRHVDDLDDQFRRLMWQSSRIIGLRIDDMRDFENGRLADHASLNHSLITSTRKPQSPQSDDDQLINLSSLNVQRDGVFLASRPLPVMVRWQHIKERLDQRKTRLWDLDDPTVFTNLYLAMAMVKIVEGRAFQVPHTPIILPAKDGLFLGSVSRIDDFWTSNRLMFSASVTDSFELAQYAWLPCHRANIWTYIGMHELRPGQNRLRYQLSEFFSPSRTYDLHMGLEMYGRTVNDTASYENDPRRAGYESQLRKLEDIMDSDLWRREVRMPSSRFSAGKGPSPSR